MARRSVRNYSAYERLTKQASDLLVSLRKQIHGREMELSRLRAEERQLAAIAGAASSGPGSARHPASRRVNWREVLNRLPKQFKASDVRKRPGLRSKRQSEIFAGIARWMEAGLVKRRSRGEYVRVR